jgi:uncharacterized membrane protein YhiD involved in acid resistance
MDLIRRELERLEKGVSTLPLSLILINLVLVFFLVLLAAYTYRKTHSGVAYTQSFNFAMIMVAMIVCMVMMTIQSNLALSIGLVGSLSVIRFRAVIRDTRDMGFLFLAIAIGLACGACNYRVAISGTLIICFLCIVSRKMRFNPATAAEYVLIFRGPISGELRTSTEEQIRALTRWYRLRSMHETGENSVEYTYMVAFVRGQAPEGLVEALRSVEHVGQISLLSPDNDLDI